MNVFTPFPTHRYGVLIKLVLATLFVLFLLLECAQPHFTKENALQIASNSACAKEGKVVDVADYRPDFGFWFIRMTSNDPNCFLACAVYEKNGTAEPMRTCVNGTNLGSLPKE